MTARTSRTISRFKLGLLAVSALVAVVVIGLVFGLREHPTDLYHTYFDESIHGLEVGAPVTFRGMRVGDVHAIAVAPDRRHIDVSLAITRKAARRLDLARRAPDLRTRLVMQGITGLKLIDIDIDPAPPPLLPFTPAGSYIPSRRSLTTVLAAKAEGMSEDASAILSSLERVAGELAEEHLPARLGEMVDTARSASTELRHTISRIDRANIAKRLAETLGGIDSAVARTSTLLESLDGDEGLVASAQRATDLVADAGRNTRDGTTDLAATLRELSDAARSLRRFFDALDRQPDMILKGRSKTRTSNR